MNKRQQNFQSKFLNFPENSDAPEKSARVIKNGGLIVFPTKGLYGIGADVLNINAVKNIYRVKKRPITKPILMLIRDIAQVEKYCRNVPENIFSLMEKFWPGDITFVLEASKYTPDILTANSGKIGVRIPSHPFPKKLLEMLDSPITGTSANISGMNPPGKPEEIHDDLVRDTDLVINAGSLGEKVPSTIIEATGNSIEVLREGRVKIKDLKKVL